MNPFKPVAKSQYVLVFFCVLSISGFVVMKTRTNTNSALSFPYTHDLTLSTSASEFNVPSQVIVGVIVAEETLNRSFVDTSQDYLFRLLLSEKSDRWWEEWRKVWASRSKEAQKFSLRSNKWPVDLIRSGYVVSLGPSQLTPRTVFRACEYGQSRATICSSSTKDLLLGILDEETSIILTAMVIDYEATRWENYFETSIRADYAMLATLYSMGFDYYRVTYENQGKDVLHYNHFGEWVRQNQLSF